MKLSSEDIVFITLVITGAVIGLVLIGATLWLKLAVLSCGG